MAEKDDDQQPDEKEHHQCRHEPKGAPHIEMEQVDASAEVLLLGKHRRNEKTTQAEEDKHGNLPDGEFGCKPGMAGKDCHPCQGAHAIQNGLMAEEPNRVGFGGRRVELHPRHLCRPTLDGPWKIPRPP